MNEVVVLIVAVVLDLVATIAGGFAIFIRLGRYLERQEMHGETIDDHELRLRELEHQR